MRNLVYVLNDGTVVRTMDEANASGQSYKVDLENVPEQYGRPTPIMRECVDTYGAVCSYGIDRIKARRAGRD